MGVDGTVTLMVVSLLESDSQLGSRHCGIGQLQALAFGSAFDLIVH